MSNQEDKDKHSTRLQKENNAIRKQQKIAKLHGLPTYEDEGHRYAKHHALDCGNPGCAMCSNPRKTYKDRTIQEESFDQKKLHDEWNEE